MTGAPAQSMGFLVRPVDWVAFGPPRPNTAGETHRRATELPGPTTFQGIVRTALLAASGDDFSDRSRAARDARDALVGGPDALPEGWQLKGPFLTEIVETPHGPRARPWVTAPRFLMGTVREPSCARLLRSPDVDGRPSALDDSSPDAPPLLLGAPSLNSAKPRHLGGWLSPRGLRWALAGGKHLAEWRPVDHAPARDLPPFVRQQALAGLEIDAGTGTARDGMLFFADVLRFRDRSGIAGWLSAPLPSRIPSDALTRGDLAACGWRSRPAVLEELPPVDLDFAHLLEGRHLPVEVPEDQGFFLVAATPVQCKGDGLSAAASVEEDLRRNARLPEGVEVRVLAALTGPPRVIGGLLAASKVPRPNRSYWEAGSSWFFVLRGGGAGASGAAARGEALRRLNDAHVLGDRGEASFGYGHTLVAVGPTVDRGLVQAAERRREVRS
ncbi:unnamed protein product [Sorangium cellulosum So ce56]|uniref:Sorangium cellulosum 'So ce 56' complete genome n=1 Tax=Sorangium cellulosum (strain So ce56) TaxID=448385 RepID=A9G7D9_SORC5|nr:type III-B CRISPR module-associated Cmr3 family protein [Sorangium cellulosum]CAN95844.1 unnamed protein product [Sorangium cellulosum So ce56]